MSADDLDRDAWLSQALRHAPDVGSAPPAALRDAILREAAAKAKAALPVTAAKPAAGPATGFARFWSWLARPPVAAGFASVMAATLVGLMWWDEPMDEVMPRAPSREAPAATAPAATAPAVISPPTMSSSVPPAAAQPAPALPEPMRAPKSSRADAAPAAVAPEPRRPVEARKAPSTVAPVPTPAPAPAPAPAPQAAREMARANDAAVPETVRKAERAETAAAPTTPLPAPAPAAPAATGLARPAEPPMAAARAPSLPPPPPPSPDAAGAGAPARDSAAKAAESSAPPSLRSQVAPSPALGDAARQRREPLASDSGAPRSLRALADAVAAQPQRWSWQRSDSALRPMTPALQAWLSQLATTTNASDAGRPGPNAFPGSGHAITELRLLRDGRPSMLIRLDASSVVWARADEAAGGIAVELTAAAQQALKHALDDATR